MRGSDGAVMEDIAKLVRFKEALLLLTFTLRKPFLRLALHESGQMRAWFVQIL